MGGFYNKVLGFTNMAEFIGDDIATDYSALMSKVVASGNHRVKFRSASRRSRRRRSRVDRRYLEFYDGAGFSTSRSRRTTSCAASTSLRDNGIEFLDTPDSYDDPELRARIGEVRVPIEELKKRLGSWSTATQDGYLLQIFTKPMGIGLLCSTGSSGDTARWASAKGNKASSRRSSASRGAGELSGPGLRSPFWEGATPRPPLAAGALMCRRSRLGA